MNTRSLALLIVAALVCLAAATLIFSRESLATSSLDYLEAAPAEPVADREAHAPTPAEGTFRPSDSPVVASSAPLREDTGGWTSGLIRGDVQLAVSVLDRLGSMTVIVEEVKANFTGSPPRRIMQAVERGLGTPTFEVRDVPFSEYPYRVTLHVPGLNASSRTLTVNEDQPLHEDVVLSVSPGAPYSVLLRDQDGAAHPDVDLSMRPAGMPHGRPPLHGKTDNFGSAVFESVLAGSYELVASLQGQPFGEPEIVVVQPGMRNFGRKIQGQGHVMTVPRGVQLEVEVGDGFYGIEGAEVTLVRTDRRRLKELKGTTDGIGRVRFPHLQPGLWQLTVERQAFRRVDRQFTLKPDMEPQFRRIQLKRGGA